MTPIENYQSRSEPEQELIDVIGLEATLKLEQRYGGRFIYVAAAGNPGIADAIGEDYEQQLRQWYAPGDIYVPTVALKEHRNQAIAQGRNTGKTVVELASQFRLSKKRIEQILKEKYGHTNKQQ